METETTTTAESSDYFSGTRKRKRRYVHLNLLTKREHEKDKCELCERVGNLMCVGCKVTFYCGMEHFNLDKDFHEILCSRVKELRKPIEFSPQAETRERWQKQRRIRMEELYKFTWTRGQACLEAGKYDAAIPAATVSIKYAQDLYGQTPEVIPPLLITAECYVHKGKLNVADGFLAKAMSIEASWRDIRPYIKARIRRNEGLIKLARNKLSDALECFAEEIYQSTEEFGPYHIRTSGGYCYLGHVFYLEGNYATSSSLFRQTVKIWKDHLEPILGDMTRRSIVPVIAGATIKTEEKVYMDEPDKFEGLRLLTKCYTQQLETQSNYVTALDLATTCFAISMMNFICERYAEAKIKAIEGQARMLQGDFVRTSIGSKLHFIIKFCDRKLFEMEKVATAQSSETDLSVA